MGARCLGSICAFADRACQLAEQDLRASEAVPGPVAFDRGLIDAAVAREQAGGPPAIADANLRGCYDSTVFIAPPWPEIYITDSERRHDFAAAVDEYERLAMAYPALGYRLVELPHVAVSKRAALVIEGSGGP